MSAITTAAAGDWSATGTWTGGTIPGNGDTVTLNHAVTVSDSRIVGTSPAAGSGTDAVRCNAVLTIANGGFLKVRGDIGLNNVGLTVAAGGILEFDASQAGTPSTARYVCKGSNASGDVNAVITVTGTSGNHAIIRSNSGGANGRFTTDGNADGGAFVATFCDFLRIGDSSNPAIYFYLRNGDAFTLTDCTFDACGQVGDAFGVSLNGGGQLTLTRVRWVNTPGSTSLSIAADVRSGGGVRSITYCALDKNMILYQGTDYTITDSVLHYYDTTGGAFALFERNVIVFDPGSSGDYAILGLFKDCYCVWLGQPTNPHYLTTASSTTRVTGCIFDCPDGDGNQGSGDCITMNAPGSAQTITVDHNLFLHVNNQNVGTVLSCLGGANLTVVAEHNTYHGGFGIYLGETYVGYAGMVSSAKSNLTFSKSGAIAYVILCDVGTATDVVSSANADYNGKWNPNGTGYSTNLSFSSGSPGAHDVSGNPGFVDVDRNIKKWDTSLGGPGTVANALAEIALGNRTVSALVSYVKAGFAPTNTAFQAAHNNVSPSNGWMGAVEGVAILEQARFRWVNDDGSESGSTFAAAENADLTQPVGTTKRVRVQVQSTGDPASTQFKLQVRKVGNTAWRDL